MKSHDTSSLLIALWDGEDAGREDRVNNALESIDADDTQRNLVLDQILPMIPELKEHEEECNGQLGLIVQFRRLLPQILSGHVQMPTEIDELVSLVQGQAIDHPSME